MKYHESSVKSRCGDYFVNSGYLKLFHEDFRGAIEDFTKAIQIRGCDPNIFIARGIAHLELDEEKQACYDFKKAMEHDLHIPKEYRDRCRLSKLKKSNIKDV